MKKNIMCVRRVKRVIRQVCEFALHSARKDEAYTSLFGVPNCTQLGLCETPEDMLAFFQRMRDNPAERAVVVKVITHVANTHFSFETISLQLAEILHSAHRARATKHDHRTSHAALTPRAFGRSRLGDEWWNRTVALLPKCEIPLEFRAVAQEAAAFTKNCSLVVFTTVFFPAELIPRSPDLLFANATAAKSCSFGPVCYVLFAGMESYDHFLKEPPSLWKVIRVNVPSTASNGFCCRLLAFLFASLCG